MDLDSKILDVFQKMINDIIEVYTDKSDEIQSQYRDILEMKNLVLAECEPINQFMKNIDIFSKKIENRDIEVLTNNIIPNIDLNLLFESSITDIDRNNVWKYLQTFCIININLKSSLELQKLLSGESSEIDRENKTDLKNLKKIKKLKTSIDDIKRDNYELSLREVEEAERRQQQSMPDLNQMNGIFQNTEIGKLAKEIAEGMDINSMVGGADTGDTESVMKNVMNPGNFMNLFQNINSKVQEKMSSGELTEESLSQEAQKMCGNFSDNPLFKNMMNNPDIQRMQKEMESTESTAKKNQSVRVNKLDDDTPNIVPNNKTHTRLQKKVQEKKIQVSEKKPKEKVESVKVQKTE